MIRTMPKCANPACTNEVKRASSLCCSVACANSVAPKRTKLSASARRNKALRVCLECGGPVWTSQNAGKEYSGFQVCSTCRSDNEIYVRRLLPQFTHSPKVETLVSRGLLPDGCSECQIAEWQGQPAPLQVDHIDGDPRNNALSNLRLLCANCHQLTPTWGMTRRANTA